MSFYLIAFLEFKFKSTTNCGYMDIQIKHRLYITTVVLALIWLLCMGVVNLVHVQDIRAAALADCLKDNFQLFEL